MGDVKASDIAAFLSANLTGQDIIINSVSSLSNPKAKSLILSKKPFNHSGIKSLLVICTEAVLEQARMQTELSFIAVSNPRLAFA